ncbi:hypothetical protein C8R45DRAFT_127778 [Mycena sanguinolenta]|nr:hypothetical protein C8R45DRAFT_127778 [Mycena sanguinolenta]
MMVDFLELPNEVLIQILEVDPGNLGVFSISTLCRRLHYLALPIYFRAHSIPDPEALLSEDLILHSKRLHLLRPLQTALFIHSLKHISCSFSLNTVYVEPLSRRHYGVDKNLFFHQIQTLTSFLEHLERVDEVTLHFQLDHWVLSQRRDALDVWDSTMSALLDVVVDKGCTAFHMEGGMFIVHASQFQRTTSPRPVVPLKQHPAMPVLSRRIATLFGRKAKLDRALHSGQRAAPLGLRTFNIQSNILLFPPCYGWTMATLRASPDLISLSIVCADIPERDGDDILFNINAPGLKHFFMDLSCRVTTVALEQFLARHPSISASSFGPRVTLPAGMRRRSYSLSLTFS